MQQLDMFAGPTARNSDPETSRQAAARAGGAEDLILALLETCPDGLTDDEICSRLPRLYGPTLKSARSRLARVEDKRVVDSGVRRESQRRRAMVVWVARRYAR